ncbi:MAG TPA: PAS domain S-box protein [Anaerolineae bacterium]|nr:PAS domain S-box protein [Anaerolineae bacterium]HQI85636.1 PAS domain S-box protein [Anaerolineae bacterium]
MEDGDQTQAQQIEELTRLRRRVAELEAAEIELKRMEEALRRASQEWEAIFQAIGHPTLILSPQYVVMAANRAAAEATGMAAEDLVGKHCYEVFHGTSHVPTGCPMAQMLYSGHLEAAETKALHGVFFTSCTPVFDAQGKLDKVIHIATDVTDLKRAEAALKAQYSTLRGIIDSANALIFSVDRQYRYTSFNQGHAAIMKALYGAEIEIGHSLLDYMTVQEDRETAQGNLDRALAGEPLVEEAYSGEELRSRRYFRVSHSPIKDEAGMIIGVAVLAQDMTERKLAEEALHRSNRELRAISNCNQVLLRAVDEQTLLNEICRIVCDEAGYRMAWVGYAENDEVRTIRPVAWAGVEGGYLEQARLTWSGTERGRGPAGMAIRTGEITYTQDFTTDPRMAPWRESALQRGYRSSITLPLKDENARTFGIFNIYASNPNAFTSDEIQLLAELAGDLAFGINTLRTRAERKRAEEALIEAHSRLEQSARFTEALLSAIPTPVFYKDREGRYLGCNRAFTEVMGVTAAEMTGKTVYELWPSEHAQVYHSKDLELMGHPVRQVYEFMVRDKDGANRPVIYAKDVFRDENDQVAGIVGAFLDITERKKAEMQIQASEQLFRALVENSPDFIARYDREYRRVYVNPAIQKLFGKPAEDVLDKTPADESPVYAPQIYIDQLRKVLETAAECAIEMPFRTAQGEMHWGHMRFVPEFGPDGQVASVMAIGRDIHEIKQAEQERLAHLRFFECMDRINRAIQGTTDLEQMMSDVLDVVLTIFDCDRAGLVYPCDPEAATWHVPMERTRPEYPGAHLLAGEIPMDAGVARKQRTMLATDGPVTFGPGSAYPLPAEVAERFNFQSLMGMALQPKVGKPWEFMLQQCSYPRVWTPEEERLFQEIGRRLEDSLSTLLAYQQLQDSEARYRLIAENTADTITVFDFDLKPVYVSPSVFRLRGYTAEETMAQSLDQILTPASLQTINELSVEQVVLGADETAGPARTVLLELEVYCKNGTTIWVELTTSILRDAHSNPTGILAVVRDITARKQAEMILSQERELLRTLVDNLPEEVYVKDRERRFLLVNEWVMRSVGVQSADEIIGKRDEDFLPPYLAKQFADEEETIMRTGIPLLNDEHTPPHKPGPPRWYLRTKLPLRDGAGNIIGLVGLGRDITERKRAEEALRRAHDEMEGRVNQRTAELRRANEQLTALYRVGQVITAPLQLKVVLDAITRSTAELLGADTGVILLLDEAGETLTIRGAFGLSDTVVKGTRDRIGESIAGRVAQTGQPIIANDLPNDSRFYNPSAANEGLLACASVPLVVGGKIIGTLDIHSKTNRHAFNEEHIHVLNMLASQAAIAIENARLYEQLQLAHDELEMRVQQRTAELAAANTQLQQDITERKRVEDALRQNREAALQFSAQLAALQQVTIQLSKAESSDDLCQRAVELARARLGFDRVGIWFIDEDRGFLRGSFGVDEQGKLRDERNLRAEFKHEGLGWEVYSQKHPVAYSEHTPLVHQGQELGEGTLVAGALWDGDQVIGLMYTDNLISHQPITEQQLEILRLYATTLGHLLKRKWVETERERLAAQVSEQARELRQILATVPEGVLLLDGERRIVQANPVAEKDLATLAGVKVGDVLTHLGNRSLAELLTSPSTRGLWHEVRADQRIFEVIARPMDNALEPEHWVLVINDVTQAREVREQLQQQERMAAVGQLAAGIAHDFNNIMAIIVLYAQMTAQVENLPALVQERMAIINQQARHATQLIQQILDFSRRSVLERQPLDLLPLLKEQCKLLERTLPENIEISLDYEPAEYIVNADLTRMQQVLMNLAVNARDAMPKGGKLCFALSRPLITDKIRCVTSDEIPGGEWVRLAVTDTGSGIPAEVLPRIFEPFFTTKAPGQGTGLGLSQVYGIVGAHEGHIDVSTKVGKGTTFFIYLPPLLTRQPAMPVLEAQTVVPGGGETLLVVEDDATLRKVFVDTLRALDYQVLEAANGQEALDILQQRAGEIALVISDLVMPGMGGQALFHAMRRRNLTLPVIMLSGHPMEQELQRLQAEGLTGWLLKPPDMSQLSHLLARVLQEKAD